MVFINSRQNRRDVFLRAGQAALILNIDWQDANHHTCYSYQTPVVEQDDYKAITYIRKQHLSKADKTVVRVNKAADVFCEQN